VISDVYRFITCLQTDINDTDCGTSWNELYVFFKETCLHILSDVSFLILLNINRQYNCFMDII